jgi:hypothetical protein
MAIRGSSLASAIVPVGGPAGLPGQGTYAAWLTLPGNAGKSLEDFMAAQKGADGKFQSINGFTGPNPTLDDIGALAKAGPGDALTVTSLGNGAVARTVANSIFDFSVNVKHFGAKGDNATDDTVAIQKAVAFAALIGGCKIFFPAGIYLISAAIAVPAGKCISFEGVGSGASIIRQTSATADGIVYDNTANGPYLTQGQHVRSLTIEAGAGLVTSGFFGQGSTGRGIVYIHGNDNSGVRDVSINGFATGLALLGCYNTLHTNFRVMFGSADAILIDKAPDGTVGAGNRLQQVKPSNNGFSGDNSASHGIRIRASGGEYLAKIDATSFFNALLIDPRAGDQVAYLFFDTILCDTSVGDGAIFDASAGLIVSVAASQFWACFGGARGVVTKGPNLHGLRCTNARIRENAQFGWDHLGGDGIEWICPEIHANGRGSTAGTYSGVRIFSGATAFKSFAILGGSIGNAESSFSAQGEAIRFLGGAAQFRVQGVDMTGAGGGKSPVTFADESQLLSFKMLGNLPAATYGVNPSERIAQTIGGFVAAGADAPAGPKTVYFEPAGPSAYPNTLPFFTARPLLAGKVYVAVSAAPGAGQTFTFRLVQNGTPVGATGVISGASSFAVTFYPGVVLSPGDSYELMAVGSSGAAATIARGFLQMEP